MMDGLRDQTKSDQLIVTDVRKSGTRSSRTDYTVTYRGVPVCSLG